jgi:hypothetical protein
MQPLRTRRLPGQRGLQRLAVVSLGPGRALDQPDRLAPGYVDGR